jgi:hypothetical protein
MQHPLLETPYLDLTANPPEGYAGPDNEPLMVLGPLARINVFVGANNSGKSRLLRFLANWRRPGGRIVGPNDSSLFGLFRRPEHVAIARAGRKEADRLGGRSTGRTARILETAGNPHSGALGEVLETMNAFVRGETDGEELARALRTFTELLEADGLERESVTALKSLIPVAEAGPLGVVQPPSCIYVPCLRTAHPIPIDNKVYDQNDALGRAARTNFNLGEEGKDALRVHSGSGLWNEVDTIRRSDVAERRRLEAFNEFLSKKFLDGVRVEIVAKRDGNRLDVTLSDPRHGDEERPLHHLGDGVNALIVILYPAFTAPPGSWIFIEEPENSLHPGLQRAFIEALLKEEQLQSHTFFLTTHSNHLLEHTFRSKEMAVFSFRSEPLEDEADRSEGTVLPRRRFSVRPLAGPDNHLLEDLGVTNASVLLANCTLWVEGPTDRQYLRAFLRCHEEHLDGQQGDATDVRRRFHEDLHYAFFEFAGSNVEHYAFGEAETVVTDAKSRDIRARFLSNRIFLLHDRDEGKEARFKRLEEEASGAQGFVFRLTQGREIENEIGPDLLADLLPKLLLSYPVDESHVAEVRKDRFKDTPLGEYLRELLGLSEAEAKFRDKSGTLTEYYKRKLASLVSEPTHATWSNIGPRARALAEAAYAFIKRHNP